MVKMLKTIYIKYLEKAPLLYSESDLKSPVSYEHRTESPTCVNFTSRVTSG